MGTMDLGIMDLGLGNNGFCGFEIFESEVFRIWDLGFCGIWLLWIWDSVNLGFGDSVDLAIWK